MPSAVEATANWRAVDALCYQRAFLLTPMD